MTFEEAGAQFVQLQAQWRTGVLPPAQYQSMVAQLRVQDASGRWWQLEPNSGQWMMWNGAQWVVGPQTAPPPSAPQRPPPQRALTVPAKKAGPALWEGLAPVLPGFAMMVQR